MTMRIILATPSPVPICSTNPRAHTPGVKARVLFTADVRGFNAALLAVQNRLYKIGLPPGNT